MPWGEADWKAASSWPLMQESRGYWEALLNAVDKPVAKELADKLDPRYPTGVPNRSSPKGGKKKAGENGNNGMLAKWLNLVKLDRGHSQKIVLVKVGLHILHDNRCIRMWSLPLFLKGRYV